MIFFAVRNFYDTIFSFYRKFDWSKNLILIIKAEGAFKKLKPEPNSGLSSVSGSVSSPGSGGLPQHAGHTPTTVSCPTPARRRHRTTFTQVRIKVSFSLCDDCMKIFSRLEIQAPFYVWSNFFFLYSKLHAMNFWWIWEKEREKFFFWWFHTLKNHY